MANTNAEIPTSIMIIELSKEVETTRQRMVETSKAESLARSEACSAINAYNSARHRFQKMTQEFVGRDPL
jgi:hypothetical protein